MSPGFAIKPPKELMCSPFFEGLILCSYLDNSSILSFSRYSAPPLITILPSCPISRVKRACDLNLFDSDCLVTRLPSRCVREILWTQLVTPVPFGSKVILVGFAYAADVFDPRDVCKAECLEVVDFFWVVG